MLPTCFSSDVLVRTRFQIVLCAVALLVLTLCGARTASAQAASTINQTTCIPGGNASNCLTPNGFLQDLIVTCPASGSLGMVNALASITDRSGPNRITISGTCSGGAVMISGFNRLVIQGSGATINNQAFNITNSRNIMLKSLTFSGLGTLAPVLGLLGSSVILDGVTIQNNAQDGISLTDASTLNFTTSPSSITGNGAVGIRVGSGSIVTVANVTISNNGHGFIGPFSLNNAGISASKGGAVVLTNHLGNMDVSADISGNEGSGIIIDGGTLTTDANNPSGLIHIHNNGGVGLALGGAGFTEVGGHLQFDGNNPTGQFPGPFQVAVLGGTLGIGGGVLVPGGIGALFNATLIIGDPGPMTVTGEATLAFGSIGVLSGPNSIDTLTCDNTSWAATDNQSTVQTNTCPSDSIVSITAGSGISSTGGRTPTLSLDTGVTDARYLRLSGGTLTGGVTAPTFTGIGAGLTNLDPANLGGGTAGINVTGNAATASDAAALGGVLAANYARKDVGNAFTGNQSVTGNISTTGSLSIGGGTAIAQHLSATFAITVPSLKPNTCTSLTQPLNGALAGGSNPIALGVPSAFMSAGGFLMFQAWESGANMITIRVCNVKPNGPKSSAISNTIRVDLWKH